MINNIYLTKIASKMDAAEWFAKSSVPGAIVGGGYSLYAGDKDPKEIAKKTLAGALAGGALGAGAYTGINYLGSKILRGAADAVARGVKSGLNKSKKASSNKYLLKASGLSPLSIGGSIGGAGVGYNYDQDHKLRNSVIGGIGGAAIVEGSNRLFSRAIKALDASNKAAKSTYRSTPKAAAGAAKIRTRKTVVHEHYGNGRAKTSTYTYGADGKITPTYSERDFKDLPPNVKEYFKKNPKTSKLTREEIS